MKIPFAAAGLACLFLLALSPSPAFAKRPTGIPEIDSLPADDWRVATAPLSPTRGFLFSLLPGGGQLYGGHPMRAGFLIGLETGLLVDGLWGKRVFVEKRDAEIRSLYRRADSLFDVESRGLDPGARDARIAALYQARKIADLRVKQQDLANSEIAWGLGLHFYGMLDAVEIVEKSQGKPRPVKSARRALLYGALLPGGGQLYNRRFGKLGMLYMALGSSAASIVSRQTVVDYYEQRVATAEAERNLDGPPEIDLEGEPERLGRELTLYRKRRNQYYWAIALLHLYAVLDGMVDASLSEFDQPGKVALVPGEKPMSLALEYRF